MQTNCCNYQFLFKGIEMPVEVEDGSYVVPINLDNAATTPPLKHVDQFVCESISMYGSVGRAGQKAAYCTEAYIKSKEEILSFFNATKDDGYTVIYVRNTTDGINLLSRALKDQGAYKILTTRMEHHANDLPWRENGHVFYIDTNKRGRISLSDVEEKMQFAQGTIKFVSVTGASNVTGYINPIYEIAKIAHRYGAYIIVDGAQLVAHKEVYLNGTGNNDAIDFMVFSGHKMYAPFGTGVVIGRQEVLNQTRPYLYGGGAVKAVFDDDVYWKDTPDKDEAGTPNFLGAMAVVAATAVLKHIGFKAICQHERNLKERLLMGLSQIPKVILYGDSKDKERLGVVPFNIEGIHHKKVGQLLADKRAIAVRTGCFCAHPYVARLLGITDKERYRYMLKGNVPEIGMVRASLALYNTKEEVDEFLNIVEYIATSQIRGYGNKFYF